MYKRVIITEKKEFLTLSSVWNTLAERQAFPTIFYTWEWLSTWWLVVGEVQPETELHLVVIQKNEETVAIAPLMELKTADGVELHFLGYPYSDYSDVLILPEERDFLMGEITGYLKAHLHLWNTIRLSGIPDRSPTKEILRKTGWFSASPSESCAVADLTNNEHVARIVTKKNQLRNIRLLNQSGALSCRHLFDEQEIKDCFELFCDMHNRRWLGNPNAVGTFEDPLVKKFFDALIPVLAPKEWLMFTELRYNELPIAYYYAFHYNQRYWGYRTCYEEKLARFSPGHIQLKFIVECLLQKNSTEMDLLRGDYSYKSRYADMTIINWQFHT